MMVTFGKLSFITFRDVLGLIMFAESTSIDGSQAKGGMVLHCGTVVNTESRLATIHAWPAYASYLIQTSHNNLHKIGFGA